MSYQPSKNYQSPGTYIRDASSSFEVDAGIPPAPKKKVALPAKWLPIGGFKAPLTLDGSLAGDVGFDPLGFAKSAKTLFWMREAEIKHGRLAMLAAIGW